MKRELTSEERALTEKNLIALRDELDYCNATIEQSELGIKIAPIIYKRQLAEMNAKLNERKGIKEQLEFSVKETAKQLKEGVEVKEPKKELKK